MDQPVHELTLFSPGRSILSSTLLVIGLVWFLEQVRSCVDLHDTVKFLPRVPPGIQIALHFLLILFIIIIINLNKI